MFYLISKAIWPVVAPSNAFILITAATTVWAVLWHSKLAASAVAGVCALVIGGFTPLGYWLMLPLENRFPPWKADSQTVVDGIIVLGGESREQITDLVELSRDFPQARLVYSGPGEESDAEHLLTKFSRVGVIENALQWRLGHEIRLRTPIYSAELIKPNPNERWLLVTAAFHMPRAIGCFRRVGFKVEAYPTEYTTGKISYLQTVFGLSSGALSRLDIAMKEWLGPPYVPPYR